MDLILASSSPYRRELLERLGLSIECIKPELDEAQIQSQSDLSVQEKAEALALAKAKKVQEQRPDQLILAGDQIASLESQILTKPGNRENTIRQLTEMQGREHKLYTSICILGPNSQDIHTNIACLKMRKLSPKEIESYVDLDQPFDCAGAYKLEKAGIALFEKIDCDDFTAIQGIPLIQLTKCLIQKKINLFANH